MARRLLGTATTNSSGVATLSYTGQGLGKIQVVATSGDLESDRFEMWDVLKYDSGLYGSYNDNIWTSVDEFSRTPSYTEINEDLDITDNFVSSIIMSGNKTIEWDISMPTISASVGSVIQFRKQGTQSQTIVGSITPSSLGITSSNSYAHVKIVILNNVAYVTSDKLESSFTVNLSDTYDRVSLRCEKNSRVRFKDVKVYNA